jgi:hypothetical protein
MDEAVVALAHRGLFVTLKPGPFQGSDMQISVKTRSGRMLSVMTDTDIPALYEVVDLDAEIGQKKSLLGEKLPLAAMTELVFREVMR